MATHHLPLTLSSPATDLWVLPCTEGQIQMKPRQQEVLPPLLPWKAFKNPFSVVFLMTPFQLFIQLKSQTHHYLATFHQPLIPSSFLLLSEATAHPIAFPSQRTHFPLPNNLNGTSKLIIHLLNLPTLTQDESKCRWQFALCAVNF